MDIGITTRSFPDMTNAEAAARMREIGFTCTELCFVQSDSNYWVYNGRSDLADMSDARFAEIVATYREQGIEVPALGVFTNLIEPDETQLQANLDYYRRHMELAAKNNIPFLPTECGFIPGQRGINSDCYEERFDYFKNSLKKLCEYADEYDVHIALECCVLDVVPSAKRAADLHEQIGSDRLKFLLDPANLIANSSEEDMFYYMSENVAYFHGKDRKVNDRSGRLVGDGDISWTHFLSLYHQHNEGAPFILEYTRAHNAKEIYDRVQTFDEVARKLL